MRVRAARSRALSLLLGVALLWVLVTAGSSTSSASDTPGYRITDLGALGPNQFSFAYGINNAGQAVGASHYDAVLFDNGHVSALGTAGCPVGGADNVAYDINGAGQIVGTTCYGVGRPIRAVLWDRGTISDLGTLPGGTFADARAINDVGQIVGTSELRPYEAYAVLWENGKIANLGALPGGTDSAAYDINDMGQVVGVSSNPRARAVLWENGNMKELGTLAGTAGASSYAYGINNRGQVVGAPVPPPRGTGAGGPRATATGIVLAPTSTGVGRVSSWASRGPVHMTACQP